MASDFRCYQMQPMPPCILASAPSRSDTSQYHLSFGLSNAHIDDEAMLDRRMSSLGCSTSSSSSRHWQIGRTRFQRHLPFASISSQQTAATATARSPTSSNTTDRQGDAADSAAEPNNPVSKLKQLSPEQIKSAIDKATAKDTFKAGDLLANGRYKLIDKLGLSGDYGIAEGLPEGRFTTLWDATDNATGKQVVVKCVEGGDAVSYLAGTREASLHAQACRHPNILQLLDAFEHRSSNGRHACMVLEKAGSNLYIVEQLYGGRYRDHEGSNQSGMCLAATPLGRKALRSFARQTLQALEHLHEKKGLVHMDISSDNILLDKPFQHIREISERALIGNGWQKVVNFGLAVAGALGSTQAMQAMQKQVDAATDDPKVYHEQNLHTAIIKLTDFGRAVPYSKQQQQQQQQHEHNRDGLIVMNDPGLRPPEEILGMEYTSPAYDIWRTGCLMFELATNVPLFSPVSWSAERQRVPQLSKYSDDMMHLLDMQTVLGQMPREFIHKSPLYSAFFMRQNDQLKITKSIGLRARSESVGRLLLRATNGNIDTKQARGFQDFVSAMLMYDPAQRPSAAQMLQHTWLNEVEEEEQLEAAAASAAAASQDNHQ